MAHGNWSSNKTLQNLFILEIQRRYATLFLMLKGIPNPSTKHNESHLNPFRGKRMNTDSEKSVFESQLKHILTLDQIL